MPAGIGHGGRPRAVRRHGRPNPQNIKNPIFGYGLSAVTAADRFTYGLGSSLPATVMAAGADAGGGPDVRVFNAANGAQLGEFMAYDAASAAGSASRSAT